MTYIYIYIYIYEHIHIYEYIHIYIYVRSQPMFVGDGVLIAVKDSYGGHLPIKSQLPKVEAVGDIFHLEGNSDH